MFEKIGQFCGNVYKEFCQKKIAAAAFQAGEKAFNDSIREQVKLLGNSELSTNSYNFAKTLKELAKESTTLQQNLDVDIKVIDIMNSFADGSDGANLIIGQLINYKMGGNGEDGTEAFGGDTKDVLFGALTSWLGVKINNLFKQNDLYDGGGALNYYDVTVRVENGQIILGILGYIAEINILENIYSLSALLFEGLFSWLETLWRAGKQYFDTESIPDERVRMLKSTVEIVNQLEKQKQEFGKFEWQYTEYKKKTSSGYETII